jgi:hypothetical protein
MTRGLNVFVNIGGRLNSSLGSSARAAERRMSAMGRHMKLIGAETTAALAATEKQWGRFQRNASNFASSVSAPMGLMAAVGGRAAYQWAKVGNELQAVTNMTDRQRRSLEGIARSQIGDPTRNLSAALDLARSGFSASEIAATMPVVNMLSRSDPSVDQTAAADIATNILKGMRIPVSAFAQKMDGLALAASKSSTDIRLLGLSFKYAGPTAARMGASFEEVNAAFMTMADAGIKGSESGVALRSMFARMVKPTKGAMAAMSSLNVHLGDYVKGRRAATGQDVANWLQADGVSLGRQSVAGIDRILSKGLNGSALVSAITDAVVASGDEAASAIDRSALSTAISDALTSQAEKVNFMGFINALDKAGVSQAQWYTIWDQRQGGRLDTLRGPDMARNLRLLQQGSPKWLLKMFNTSNKGIVGSVGRLSQSMGNFVISLSESGVIDIAANMINKLSNAIMSLSKSSPGTLKALTGAFLGMAALGPVSMMVGGLASGVRLLGGAASLASRLIVPLGTGLLRLTGLTRGIGGMAVALRLAASVGLAPLIAIGLPAAAAIGAIGVGLALIVAKWNGIKAFLKGFGEGFSKALNPETRAALSAFGSAVGGLFKNIFSWLSPVVGALKAAFGWLGKMFAPANAEAWGNSGRSFGQVIGGMVNGLTSFVSKITQAINRTREFFRSVAGQNIAAGLMLGNPAGAGVAFGRSLSGRRALGGGVSRGGLYTVGENGRELFAPGQSGTIIPARATAAIIAAMAGGAAPMAAAASPLSVGAINVYEASDAKATAKAVRAELQKMQREALGYLND